MSDDKPTEMDAARVRDERDDLRSRLALQVELVTLGTDIGDSLRLRLAAAEAEAAKYRAALRRISNGRLGGAPDGTHIQARDVAIAALASPVSPSAGAGEGET